MGGPDSESHQMKSANSVCDKCGTANAGGGESRGTQTVRMLLGRIRRTRLVTPGLKKEFMLG